MTGPAAPGLFVTLEGGEGVGKSTQTRLLAERLRAEGREVVTTREPGGSAAAERLREILLDPEVDFGPMEQVLLFYAARRHHVDHLIQPALTRGATVICDRFSDSTIAYQGGAGGVSAEAIRLIDQTALGGFRPDLTILLDLPAVACAERVAARGDAQTSFEQAPLDFHERLRQAFLRLAESERPRFETIDAALPIDAIAERIHAAVAARASQALRAGASA